MESDESKTGVEAGRGDGSAETADDDVGANGGSSGEVPTTLFTNGDLAKEDALRETGSEQALMIAPPSGTLVMMEQLAAIPEEELWLQNQRSRHTRRAYKEDVHHFMRTFGIKSREELRATSRAAVIAWVRTMEQDGEMPRTIGRRLAALSSLFNHLIDQHLVTTNPVQGVKRPTVSRDQGVTAAFDAKQARALLEAPGDKTLLGLRDRAILSVLLQAGPRRAEVARMKVKDFHLNMGYDSLRYVRKGNKQHSVTLHPQTAQRIRDYLARAGHGEELEGPLFRPVKPNWKTKQKREMKPDEPMFLDPDAIDRILRKYVRKVLGIARGFSAHSCRSTFATTALENRCPLEDVQQTLGHADSRTTKLYDKRGDNPERSATFFANY
jgi:site-specific recombinase XerD